MFCNFCKHSKIQNGCHFWQDFLENFLKIGLTTLKRYPMGQKFRRNRSISHGFQDKHVFAFYAEIQDGCQKWWENDFQEKSPVDSAYMLQVQNFVKIALSRSVSEIKTFLHFTQKLKIAAKSGGKTIFWKCHQ